MCLSLTFHANTRSCPLMLRCHATSLAQNIHNMDTTHYIYKRGEGLNHKAFPPLALLPL